MTWLRKIILQSVVLLIVFVCVADSQVTLSRSRGRTTSYTVTNAPDNVWIIESGGLLTLNPSASGNVVLATTSTSLEWSKVIGEMIQDGAVTEGKLAAASVSGSKIQSGAVSTSAILNGAVDSTKIANGAVLTGDIGDSSILGRDIASGAIGSVHLASGAVTASKIGNAAVQGAHIAAGAINAELNIASSETAGELIVSTSGAFPVWSKAGSSSIESDAITSSHIASGAVGASEIADSSITQVKVERGSLTGMVLFDDFTGTGLQWNQIDEAARGLKVEGVPRSSLDTLLITEYYYPPYANWIELDTRPYDTLTVVDTVQQSVGSRYAPYRRITATDELDDQFQLYYLAFMWSPRGWESWTDHGNAITLEFRTSDVDYVSVVIQVRTATGTLVVSEGNSSISKDTWGTFGIAGGDIGTVSFPLWIGVYSQVSVDDTGDPVTLDLGYIKFEYNSR